MAHEVGDPPQRTPLSREMQDRLRHGIEDDPHKAYRTLVTSMVQHHWTEQQMREALLDPEHRGGWWYRRLAERNGGPAATGDLRYRIESARKFIAANPPVVDRQSASEKVAQIHASAEARPWKGRTGTTDRLVLDALCRLAQKAGGPVLRASLRQITEEAGLGSADTAHRATRRLIDAGWLKKTHDSTDTTGTGWTLRKPTEDTGTVVRLFSGAETVPISSAHDAFRRGALGGTGYRVLRLLLMTDDPASARVIAEALGVTDRTVRTRLGEMHGLGLVERLDDGTWRPLVTDAEGLARRLDAVAKFRRTAGRGEKVRERHDKAREMWLDWASDQRRSRLGVIAGGRPQGRPVKSNTQEQRRAAR
ncbi:HTH domain-containing protein [Janibacter limosus]|uniref:HTH domain-containing protein n=1 Tax=Janibacter limosus TaxID=53458 RepID=A0A4P6MRT7_9MICO|nr:HTH domain-containing protein [Janibacter limosus]QBF46391.1 HTH domain-containing protein [Janibacter limosus]